MRLLIISLITTDTWSIRVLMTIMVCPKLHRSRLNIVSARSVFTLKSKYDVVYNKRAQSVSCKKKLENVSFPVQSSSTQVGTAPNTTGLVHHAIVYCTDVYLCSKYAVWNTALDFFSFGKALKCVWGTCAREPDFEYLPMQWSAAELV